MTATYNRPPARAPETKAAAPSAGPRLPSDSAERKTMPMATGVLDYFTDALADVAQISYKGNQKHNPGEPLHWSRGKSADHADCIMRHLAERGSFDAEGNRHSAQMVWRGLALLQEEIELERGIGISRGSTLE